MSNFSQLLENLSDLSKPRFKFILTTLPLFLMVYGKVTFRNLARHCSKSEKYFRRHFARFFYFIVIPKNNREALAIDATFIPKSGKKTYGLAKCWNGAARRAERGLEISTIAHIDVERRSAYALDARQTPPKAAVSDETKIDIYIEQLPSFIAACPKAYNYLLADGFYAKRKFIDATLERGAHLISKLRHDANLRYVYNGPQRSGPGRPKGYDGKVDFDQPDRFERRSAPESRLSL